MNWEKYTPRKAKLHVRPDATPRFFKSRPVPFAIKEAIGKELDKLEEQGILQKVDSSDWAAPIVPVPKKDGRFRICGDYKVTINQSLLVDQYPLPKPEDLFATLANGKHFTKLDLSQAYLQLALEEDSMKYVTINTHQGLYQFTRLPFGISSAPAIFQRLMDKILHGLSGVICYIDDILITGKNEEEHLQNLAAVLNRLEKHGFRLKMDKCRFLIPSVEYLGHQIDEEGIRAVPNKVEAITNAPQPTNVQELQSFLGLLNYYGKFIRNLSSIIHPLNGLLHANQKWKWTDECTQAFEEAKRQLVSAHVLTHYDPTLPINLAADASAYGIGAVISHVLSDGSEKPISFASRTLTAAEKNYSQLEKEAISLIFGVRKFHQYLYGRKFTLITDHKPATRRDPVLSKIVDYVRRGWPKQVPDNIQPYLSKQEEITIESGCLLWGIQVIIPKSLQDRMLQTLHQNHPGVARMKSIARSYMWWLGIDKDIENLAKSCLPCLKQITNSCCTLASMGLAYHTMEKNSH